MADFAQTRSEYLKIMMGERKDALAPYRPEQMNDLGDTSFDVASLSDDDINNAIKNMTGTEYENTPLFASLGEEQSKRQQADKSKYENQNFWERASNFFSMAQSSTERGLLGMFDDFGDAIFNFVGGLFGGGWWGQENDLTRTMQQWTEFDWIPYVQKAMDISTLGTQWWLNWNTYNKADYWTDWSYEGIQKQYDRQKVIFGDGSGGFGDTFDNLYEEGGRIAGRIFGEILLDKGIGKLLSGASAAAKAGKAGKITSLVGKFATKYPALARLLIRTGTSTIAGIGEGFETATKEGASYQSASYYGFAKGAVRGVTTAATYGLGAKGYGPYAQGSTKFGGFIFEKTGSAVWAKTVDILQRAGLNAVISAAETAADPALKQITYNANALQEAYGTDEARAKTFGNIAATAVSSFVTSAVIKGVPEIAKRVQLGKSGYTIAYAETWISEHQAKASSYMDKASSAKDEASKMRFMKMAYQEYQRASKFDQAIQNFVQSAEWQTLAEANPQEAQRHLDQAERYAQMAASATDEAKAQKYIQLAIAEKDAATSYVLKGFDKDLGIDLKANKATGELVKNAENILKNSQVLGQRGSQWVFDFVGKNFAGKYSAYDNDFTVSNETTNADGSKNAVIVPKNGGVAFNATYVERTGYLAIGTNGSQTKVQLRQINGGLVLAPKNYAEVQEALNLVQQNKGNGVPSQLLLPVVINGAASDVNVDVSSLSDSALAKLGSLTLQDFQKGKSGSMFAILGDGKALAVALNGKGGEIIEASKTDSWVKPSEEVPAISTGASEAPKPEPVKPLDLAAEPSVVKEAANAKVGKVYSLASAKGAVKIVENTIKELLELDDIDGGHTKFHIAKGSSAKALFDNLNLGTKEQQLAVKESLRTKLLDTKVKYTLSSDFYAGDGEEYTSTVRELLSLLDDEDLKKFDEDFNRAWDELVESGDESRLTKVIEAYENKLEKWVTKAKDLSVKKKFSNILSRNRTKIRDRVTGDYDYEKIEERDLHTINMLAKPLDSLKRSYGTYRADKETLDAFLTAQKYYVEENYTEDSSIDFSEDVKAALDAVVDLIKGDVNNPEISAETYAALVKYQKAVLDYERELKRVEITDRKPAAYAASAELAHYDTSVVQKIFSPIIDNFGGISGEILTKFGYGEITKKFVVEPIKAYGKKMDFTYKSWDEVGQYLPKRGFHSKQKVGELNGVKVTRGELIFAYMSTHLAPVNAENINTGGIGFRSKNGAIKWAFDGDIDAIKTAIADLISDEDVKIATDLFNEIINGTWHKQYIDFERDVKHKVDVETVDQYLPMYKENDFQASIDKMVSGDPIFRYSIKRTGDKRGLIMVDIVDVLSDYIDRLGTMMYQLPANKAANALLNSKTESGKRLATEIKDKYGSKTLRMLRDVNNAFVKKSAQETQNIVTKVLGVLTHGYTVAKLSDPIRPIKNYFSYITSNMDFAGMPRATVSRFNKDVMDDVKWLIENKIFTMKYRARSGDVLKGNTQTVVGGIQAKVDKVLMAEVTAVDWFAMDSGLVQIVAEARHRGIDVRSNEGADLVESIWTIFYLSNVGSTPLHKSRLSNNVLTKYVFDILAGAKRAQVASFAMQGSLFHQFKGITEDEVNEAVRRAEALVRSAEEETNRATEAEERSIDELHEAREERDRLIKEKASEEDIARARETVKQKKEDAQRAKSEREAAEEEEAKAHSQEREAKNQQEGFRQFKFAGGKRIPINIIGKMILVGVLTTGVSMLTKFLYGKKNFDEYNAKEIITDAALNSFVNWVPVLDTLVGGIMNGHEIDPPSVSALNNLISTFSEIIDSFQDGKITGGLINSLITMIEGITGLPLSTVKKYVYGIMKMISPASAYKFNTLFFNMSATGLSSAAKDFAEKNDISSSADLLQTLYQTYKTGDISREVAVEQAKLIAEGFNPIARNIPEYIQDDKGEKATLSEDQKAKFSKAYAYANEQVSKLIKNVKYKDFDAETKAKTIKKIYDIYYEVARYQSLGVDPDSRIGKLLAYCGGDYDIAQTLFLIQQNAELMDNRRFTKKEQAVRLVNKQQMSRPQKLLTLYLMGYGVSSENKKIVQNYLISLGFTKKQASEFLP